MGPESPDDPVACWGFLIASHKSDTEAARTAFWEVPLGLVGPQYPLLSMLLFAMLRIAWHAKLSSGWAHPARGITYPYKASASKSSPGRWQKTSTLLKDGFAIVSCDFTLAMHGDRRAFE